MTQALLGSLTGNLFNSLKHIKLGRLHLGGFGVRVPADNETTTRLSDPSPLIQTGKKRKSSC